MTEQIIIDWVLKSEQSGSLRRGDQLPSENILAHRFRVHRNIVRTALKKLEEMGKVRAFQGKGRFLQGRLKPINLTLTGDESFSHKVRKAGLSLTNNCLSSEWVIGHSSVRAKLGMTEDERLFAIDRLRLIDGHSLAVHRSYLCERLFPRIEDECWGIDSMYDYFESKGYKDLCSGEAWVSVALPSADEQEILGIPALIPILIIESDTRSTAGGEPIEITEIKYRGDVFKYQI